MGEEDLDRVIAEQNLIASHANIQEKKRLKAEVERLKAQHSKDCQAHEDMVTACGLHPHSGPDDIVKLVERLKTDQAEILKHLVKVVGQACWFGSDYPQNKFPIDSMGTPIFAEAMLYLAKIGRIELDGEPIGYRMTGRWKEE